MGMMKAARREAERACVCVWSAQAFNNVDAMRQQFKPSWRVHGIITDGGLKPNIIPDHCAAEW